MNRVSTASFYERSILQMEAANKRLETAQTQVATGKKLITAADDPMQAPIAVSLRASIARREGFQDNILAAQRSLSLTETSLNSMVDTLQRLREVSIQAVDGTLSDTDKASLAREVQSRADEVFSYMNSKGADGNYLFSGSKTKTEPFERQTDGSIVFNGNSDERQIQVAENLSVKMRLSGRDAFTNLPAGALGQVDLIGGLTQFANSLAAGGDQTASQANTIELLDAALDQVNSMLSQVGVQMNTWRTEKSPFVTRMTLT